MVPITNSVLLLASEIAGILNWVFTLPCLFLYIHNIHYKGLPSGKEPTCQCRRHNRWGWIPGLGRSLRGGPGNPLQCSCLENPMDKGAWRAAVHGVAKSQTRLSDFTFTHWRRTWQPTPVFLPGESQGRGSLVGCHLWGHTELDMTEVT